MRSLEVLRVARKSSQECGWVDLYVGFVSLHFMREYFDFWEFRKTATVH
jgi:hypothetical protein